MLQEAVAPVTTLAAVLVGGLLTRSFQSSSWRRERRAEAYAAVLTAAHELQQRLIRESFGDPFGPGMDIEYVLSMTETLRSHITLAQLYAGREVDRLLAAVVQCGFELADSAEMGQRNFGSALQHLHNAMKAELHRGTWLPWGCR